MKKRYLMIDGTEGRDIICLKENYSLQYFDEHRLLYLSSCRKSFISKSNGHKTRQKRL